MGGPLVAAATKGPQVQRVHKVQRVQRGRWAAFKLWKAASYDKTKQPPLARWKTIQPGFARRKCTPIPACGVTSPRESMSLDSQVALLPYESSSFATPKGEVIAALTY